MSAWLGLTPLGEASGEKSRLKVFWVWVGVRLSKLLWMGVRLRLRD
ncbi:MAG: hypothetical protein KZQ95_06515 [Candidatus Thiodiazotropha sp. (ex Epidulcina cf. delphinae)]|nr:hypothetical protein [Candidatus Thiodiazotropha sp. (ex Epidulcina cf. delphinae)]